MMIPFLVSPSWRDYCGAARVIHAESADAAAAEVFALTMASRRGRGPNRIAVRRLVQKGPNAFDLEAPE